MPNRKPGRGGLALYRKKRNFTKTPEPRGRKGKSTGGLSYLIQKHAARRLHYDFRLELDGTLKSWAVTRGPSLNPADKRLAVHVEDHPLAYGSFEGTIPQGQYGGGTVMLWDEGTWEPMGDPRKEYIKGRLTFILHGKRLKGQWHLVRMGKASGKHENWLLIKSHDEYANEKNGDYATEYYQTSAVSNRTMDKIAHGRKEWHSNRSDKKPVKEKTTQAAPKEKAPRSRQKRRTKTGKLQPPPDFVAPELATLVTAPPATDAWVHEIKFDGYRAVAHIEDGDARLLTRADNDWTHKFSAIAKQLGSLDLDNGLLDGEIVSMNGDGSMSFHALQRALSKNDQERLHYYVFDLLFLNGENLRDEPLLKRKAALRKIIPQDHPHIHYSEHFVDPGIKVLQHACHIALEGIVSKRSDAPYRSGRGGQWLKSKCINEQEFVIGGYTLQPKHSGQLGAMLIGYYEKDDLIYAGKVGTGFSHEEAARLLKKFKPLMQKKASFRVLPPSERKALWVRPELVAQINFTEWTESGALRHPSFQGLREDKPVRQVVREKKLKLRNNLKGAKSAKIAAKTKELSVPFKPSVIAGVTLTHPDKVLYRDQGLTKKDLAEYYSAVSGLMLPHVAERPISLVRCPGGAGKPCFFQRHAGEGLSECIKTVQIDFKHEHEPYLTIENEKGLIAFVQMGVLEIHIWGSRSDKPELPDRLVFDFDPAEDVPWKKVQKAALEMKERLKKLKLESFLKFTGGKGLHVVTPILRKHDWKTIKAFTRALAQEMAHDAPNLYTLNIRKEERRGRIFIDYLRNDETSSSVAPYSTRARAGAPVALPLEWRELQGLKSGHSFTIEAVLERVRKMKKDPWSEMNKLRQPLPDLE